MNFNNIMSSIFTGGIAELPLSVPLILLTLFASLFMGLLISVTYIATKGKENHSQSFAITLVILPVILSVIIIFVGSNVARAFSLAGTLSIIRFRSAPGEPKDIGLIFFAIAAGLACGVGLIGYGILFTIFLCAVLILLNRLNFGRQRSTKKILKITIPEDLNYEHAFDDILSEYTKAFSLDSVKTRDMGSLYEITYYVDMQKDKSEREFIDALRTRNGNLNISLTVSVN